MTPQLMDIMEKSVTMKFRLSAKEAKALDQMASDYEMTRSEVVRRGIELMGREKEKREALREMISWIKGPLPPKAQWRGLGRTPF